MYGISTHYNVCQFILLCTHSHITDDFSSVTTRKICMPNGLLFIVILLGVLDLLHLLLGLDSWRVQCSGTAFWYQSLIVLNSKKFFLKLRFWDWSRFMKPGPGDAPTYIREFSILRYLNVCNQKLLSIIWGSLYYREPLFTYICRARCILFHV